VPAIPRTARSRGRPGALRVCPFGGAGDPAADPPTHKFAANDGDVEQFSISVSRAYADTSRMIVQLEEAADRLERSS
jgi:hypothetical protein